MPDQPTREHSLTHGPTPAWLRQLVRLMDNAIPIPGTRLRVGWDAIIGLLVPGAGDAASAASHVALLLAAFRARVSKVVIARMVLNGAVDALVGVVPGLGDLFDAGFKANVRNLELLERAERRGERAATIGDYAVIALAIGALALVFSVPIVAAIWVASMIRR